MVVVVAIVMVVVIYVVALVVSHFETVVHLDQRGWTSLILLR